MKKVQLQGLGWYDGVEVSTIKKGDVLVWNGGFKSRVVEIVKETKSQVVFLMQSLDSDYIGERRMGKTRLVVKA